MTADELAVRISELEGRLAVGDGFELSVVRPDGMASLLLDGSESVLASQPTWSRDGERLAWSSASDERQAILVQDFDDDGLPAGDPLVSDASGAPVFYMQWSADDDRLAYIRNSTNRGLVEVGTAGPGEPSVPVGEGAPFFISWSIIGQRIVGHVREQSIDLYRVEDGPAAGFASVLTVQGGFSAPAWVDANRVLIVAGGALAYLDVTDGTVLPIADVAGAIRFVLSPDRTKVAFQTIGNSGGPDLVAFTDPWPEFGAVTPTQGSASSLIVLDLETSEQTLVTNDLAVAWEWSPDSERLAWLDATLVRGRPLGSWKFWSQDQPLGSVATPEFVLTGKYGRNYLPFFAQYAQSVTGWSPDSSAYAFAGGVNGDTGIWIQLVDETVDAQFVSPGDFVTWGPGDVPLPPSSGPSAA